MSKYQIVQTRLGLSRLGVFYSAMRAFYVLLALSIFTIAAAADWELHEDAKSGRQSASSTVPGTGPEGAVKATLVLHHRRGQALKVEKKGNVTELPILIELCVDRYESVKGFDFLPFEGPDATAADKRLTSITIDAGKAHFAKRFTQGGWINQLAWIINGWEEPNAISSPQGSFDFTFGINHPIRDLKDFITITKLLQQSPTKIEVSVTDSKNPKRNLHFAFPTANAAEVIGKLMQ